MAGSISLFIISIAGMSALLFSNGYFKWKTSLFERIDEILLEWIKKGKNLSRMANKRTFGLLLHYLLEKTEMFFSKVFRRLKSIVKK